MNHIRDDLRELFEAGAVNALMSFVEEKGFQTTEDLKQFLRSPGEIVQSEFRGEYRQSRAIGLLKVPRLGRKSVEAIWRWANPELYDRVEKAKRRVLAAETKVRRAEAELRQARLDLQETRRDTYP